MRRRSITIPAVSISPSPSPGSGPEARISFGATARTDGNLFYFKTGSFLGPILPALATTGLRDGPCASVEV